MRALVVYESMYGNTRSVAEAIADGLGEEATVRVVRVADTDAALGPDTDLLVIGGPTHAHGMSRPATRRAAVTDAAKAGRNLTVEPDAAGDGVRELLDRRPALGGAAAAFDTRLQGPAWFTGRGSKGIARGLRRLGCSLVARPESFLVTKQNRLVDGELERARQWGVALARTISERAADAPGPGRQASSA